MMARLGDVCEIVSGTTPKSNVPEYWDGEINWVTPAELNDDTTIIYESQRKITECAVKDSSLKSFPAGTVILSSRAPIGKVAIAGVEMYCNQGFKNLICSEKIYNKYLFWFLKGKTDFLNSLGRGATFKEISKSIVENIDIPLPPIEKQKNCAVILDKLNELISLRKEQLVKLDELIKARFVEMFGDLGINSKNWPEISLVNGCSNPEDIKCGPFGTQLSKDEYQATGVPLWGIPQVNTQFKNPATDFLSEDKAKQLMAYSLISQDIVMSRKGNVGMCAIYPDCFGLGIIHSDVLRIRVNQSCFNPYFLMWQLHISPRVSAQINVVSSGAIMAGINVTKLKNILVYNPPINLQNNFATFCQKEEKQKLTIQQSLDKLEVLKKALMQEYFG